MSKEILNLAQEITNCRDSELPLKLLKLNEVFKSHPTSELPKIKHEIYKYDILEAISLSFKNEYGYITDGWNIAIQLVKIFRECTTNFGTVDKQYQDVFLPNATENILILAKKLQQKHFKSKAFSEEHLNHFKKVMSEYAQINSNNPYIALKSINSQRLFQLLLTDEQNTSAIVMNTLKSIFMIKRSNITKMPEKTVNLFLDEIIYKMATSELRDAGLAIFHLLLTLFQLDSNLPRIVVKRYKGLNFLINKWKHKDLDKELTEFQNAWNGAYQARITNAEIDEKAIMIQKTWRGYQARKRLKKLNEAFSKFQKIYQAKRECKDKKKQQQMARDELKFQLVLEHRRRQRQKKMQLLELLEILPADKIEDYLERQRHYSATKIQASFRGYRARKELAKHREQILRTRAAIKIQRAVRRWLEIVRHKLQQPAFYSRPVGLDSEKREFLFDKIRKHLESLPPHPRSMTELNELHDKGQRAFQNYVLSQRSMRQQQQKIQASLAIANHDADLILNCPKLSQVTEEDVSNYYSHKSTAVMLAAKEAHRQMLKKQRAKWWESLDDSDSDNGEAYDENFDELNANIKNMNFNAITENYYKDKKSGGQKETRSCNIGYASNSGQLQIHKCISRRQKNQLKTNNLRRSVTYMMNCNPDKSRIWSVEPETRVPQSN